MAALFLPQMRKDNNFSNQKIGEWSAESSLTDCAEGLFVKNNTDTSKISSIPDLWARPTTFKIMLEEGDQEYETQWRSVLAVLALCELKGAKKSITVENISMDSSLERQNVPSFYRAALRMLPDDYKKYEKNGDNCQIQIVCYDGKPFAIVWPSILICPAVDLGYDIKTPFSWWKKGMMEDPCQYLSQKECLLLGKWLRTVRSTLKNDYEDETVDRDRGKIRDYLEKFFKAVKQRIKDQTKESSLELDELGDLDKSSDGVLESGNRGSSIGITGFAEPIGCPIKQFFSDADIDASNVLLRGLDGVHKVLLVTEKYKDLWGKNLENITVAGPYTVESLRCSICGGKILKKDYLMGNISLREFNTEIWTEDDFFTDKIGLIQIDGKVKFLFPNVKNSEGLHIEYRGIDYAVILPIRSKVLEYMRIDEICEAELSVNGDSISICLEVKVSGFDKNKRSMIRISKEYRENDIIREDFEGVPYVDIWPNFIPMDKSWKEYYVFYDTDNQGRVFDAKPIGEVLKNKTRVIRLANGNTAKIYTLNAFPSAFECTYASGENDEDISQIGIICLDKDKLEIKPSISNCTIGIDFGTSNTIAYMCFDGQEPVPMVFEDRIYKVTEPGRGVELRRHFIPATRQPKDGINSIRTIFHEHSNDNGTSVNVELKEMLMSGNIYYLEEAKSIKDDDAISNSLYDNLKWGLNDTNMQNRAKGFLLEYCIQCMAEAVAKGAKKINWVYSYPRAFTGKDRNTLASAWDDIMKKLENIMAKTNSFDVKSKSESESVAEYFKDREEAQLASGVLCIDVGGGSTDIALLYQELESRDLRNDMKYQTSVKFAGRDILNKYLFEFSKKNKGKLSVLETTKKDYNEQLSNICEAKYEKEFNLQIEALLKYFESDVFESLKEKGYSEDLLNIILRDIGFAVGGLFFYVGVLLGELDKAKMYDLKDTLPECYIGGNASKVLNWAAIGSFDRNTEVKDMFRLLIIDGIKVVKSSDIKRIMGIKLSKDPKEEVAYGLVKDTIRVRGEDSTIDTLQGNITSESPMFAGEKFTKDGKNSETQVIDTDDIVRNCIRIDEDLPMFVHYVDKFNQYAKRTKIYSKLIDFTRDDYYAIKSAIKQKLLDKAEAANGDRDLADLEPLFILELKEAMKILAKK